MASDISVRIASPADEEDLFRLLQGWHAEEGLAPFCEPATRVMLRQLLAGAGVIGVIGAPGSIEASISLLPGRVWYSSENVVESLWNFVRPPYRKSANAKALALFAKRQSERLGLPLLFELISTGENTNKLALYERIFGPRAGAAFHWHGETADLKTFTGSPFRTAAIEDLPDVVEVCREAHQESGSFGAADELAIPVIKDELAGTGVVGLIGGRGHVEASISIHTARMWYSDAQLLEERWLFVRMPYRKSNNAKNLITFAKRQSQRLGVPLRIGVISKKDTEQKVNLYCRLLGAPSAVYFLHRPQ